MSTLDLLLPNLIPTIGIVISVFTLFSLKKQNQQLSKQYELGIKELQLSSKELKDNHDYNRRLCAYNIIEKWDRETLIARTSILNKWPEALSTNVKIKRKEIDDYYSEQRYEILGLLAMNRNLPTVYEDMQLMLNYFENLAVAIEFGVADEKVLKRAFFNTFQRWYNILGDYHSMVLQNRVYNPWKSLEWLHNRWHGQQDDVAAPLTGSFDD